MAMNQPRKCQGEFRHGLIDCGDCGDCFCAYCCPPCFAFLASEASGRGMCYSMMQCLLYPLCLCCLRSSARGKHSIQGNICSDALAAWCCPCCTALQIKREFTE